MNRFFCFYTAGAYAELAKKCVASFAEFGVAVEPMEFSVKSSDRWIQRCKARAAILRDLAAVYPDDVVGLLDADLTCLKEPAVLKLSRFGSNYDIAVHDRVDQGRMPDDRCHRYCAGILMFNHSDIGRACLRRWAELCEVDPEPFIEFREQVYLHSAIEELRKDGLRVFNLGDKYNRVPERMKEGDDTVILHSVASRKLRDTHGGGI